MRIFISYRREDCQPQATSIYWGLMNKLDAEVFLDIEGIKAGVPFKEEIESQISQADVVVVVIGDDWLDILDTDGVPRIQQPDDYVQMEIRLALQSGKPVVPVTVENARMPTRGQLPEPIARLGELHAPQVRDDSMPQDMRDLAEQIRLLVESTVQAPEPPEESPTLPTPEPRVMVEDDEIATATLAAADSLQRTDVQLRNAGRHALERDLSAALAEALPDAKVEQSWPIPNWDPQPGRFDVLAIAPDGRPRLAIEAKLKDDDRIFESLWDALKLVGLATLDHVEGIYIVAGAPVANWRLPVRSAGLFETGTHSTVELIRETGGWWKKYILDDSSGRPRWAPPSLETELVAAIPIQLRGTEWELRTLRIWTDTVDWLAFQEGEPPGKGAPEIAKVPPADTVVVAAGQAFDYYRRNSAYVCQQGRSFREVERIGFYRKRAIQRHVPRIVLRRDSVPFTRDEVSRLRATGDEYDRRIADLIEEAFVEEGKNARHEGTPYQVFLLTGPDDSETIQIQPITHAGKSAWTMGQRYVASAQLLKAVTTEDLEKPT